MKPSAKNKWALITGASSGIGAATAQRLAESGYNLVLTGRRKDKLEAIAKALKPISTEVVLGIFDLQVPAEIENFIRENETVLKNLDVLINNAGLAKGVAKVDQADLKDWDTMLDTNVRGLLHITRGVLPFLLARGSGHIVNLGSVAGRWTYPGGAVYCMTKFAVRAFSEGLRMDLAGKNIRVTNIEPGMVNTEFSLVRLGSKSDADRVYEGMTPLSADDIAETIQWTLERPKHVNVQELVIYPTDQAHVGQVHRS
jgi:3-hydroxy acid dehydrogenase/malonic semialdehyde reductase